MYLYRREWDKERGKEKDVKEEGNEKKKSLCWKLKKEMLKGKRG